MVPGYAQPPDQQTQQVQVNHNIKVNDYARDRVSQIQLRQFVQVPQQQQQQRMRRH